jgi:hypothetical protein
MEPTQLIRCLDVALKLIETLASNSNQATHFFVEEVMSLLSRQTMASSFRSQLNKRLAAILSLQHTHQSLPNVHRLLAITLQGALPFGYSILPDPAPAIGLSLAVLAERAEQRWACREEALPSQLECKAFLIQPVWDETAASIITTLIYRSTQSRTDVKAWLGGQSELKITPCVATVLHAFFDSLTIGATTATDILEPRFAKRCFSELVEGLLDPSTPDSTRSLYAETLALLLLLAPSSQKANLTQFAADCQRCLPADIFKSAILRFCLQAHKTHRKIAQDAADAVVGQSMLWLVRRFSEDLSDSADMLQIAEILG